MQRGNDLHFKSLQFSIWLAVGSFWPFIYVYYSQLGLSATQVGLVITASSLAGTLAAPYWGSLKDRLGRVRLVLTILSAGAILLCMVLSAQRSVAGVVGVAALFAIFTSGILPLLDSSLLNMLGERRAHYGAFLACGTIGFVAGSALIGVLIDRLGTHIIFAAYALGVLVFALLAQRLPDVPVTPGLARRAGLIAMIRQPDWLLFALSVFVLWISVMGALGFLGIVVVQMGGDQRLIGLAATMAALTEIPFFQYSSRILRRLGPGRMLAFAMGLYVLRLALYGLMPSPGWVLGLALLQGASYGPFLAGAVAYADQLAPAGLKATGQGLLASVMSLSNLVAGLAAGWLLDHAGRSGLFFTTSATALAALALLGLGTLRARSLRARRARALSQTSAFGDKHDYPQSST